MWSAKCSPKVIGGALNNLIQRLTYQRIVGMFTKSYCNI